ncbi:MAG TPA: hypothetical protein VH684_07090 [Xanthobacteraceae bacterium]|jgi:hypothetical protein
MSIILLVLGILVTAVGVVVVGFGTPINDLALGQTLIIAGATALVGGLLLIGLAAAVSQLAQIAEALKGRVPLRSVRPPAAAVRPDEVFSDVGQTEIAVEPRRVDPRPIERRPEPRPFEPAPGPEAADEAGESPIERLRSSMGHSAGEAASAASNGEEPAAPGEEERPPEAMPEPPVLEPAARPVAAVEPTREARLDFLFRSRAARPASETFDAMWPKGSSRGGDQPKSEPALSTAQARSPPGENQAVPARGMAPQPAKEEQRSVAILKSGVVDGMAYTLYADGSIEAQLPQGTVRFGSIAELRAHIENSS